MLTASQRAAKSLGVLPKDVCKVPSTSDPDSYHLVTFYNSQWHCDCTGYKAHGHCKHVELVQSKVGEPN